jgi:hypothetical protein
MPAFHTHLCFGKEVLKTLPEPYKKAAERFPEAFALGAQGPDILFYHKPLKSNEIRKRANIVQAWSGEKFFLAQGEKLLVNAPDGELNSLLEKNGALAAYTVGFLCHFTLDALCHPYIDGNSNEALSHGKIESEFDKTILRLNGKPIRGYSASTELVNKNGVKEAVAKTLDLDEKAVVRSIKTMRKINKMFSHKHECHHRFIHGILKMINMEKKFGDMFLHKKDDPLCVEINEVLLGKFQDAIPKASALIQEYFENLRVWVEEKRTANKLFRYDFSGIIHTEE